jgi:flagellar hook-length control protein FliK
MTFQPTIKIPGLAPDLASEPVQAAGQADLFTQLLATMDVAPDGAPPEVAAAPVSGAISPLIILSILPESGEAPALEPAGTEAESEDAPEQDAIALASLLTASALAPAPAPAPTQTAAISAPVIPAPLPEQVEASVLASGTAPQPGTSNAAAPTPIIAEAPAQDAPPVRIKAAPAEQALEAAIIPSAATTAPKGPKAAEAPLAPLLRYPVMPRSPGVQRPAKAVAADRPVASMPVASAPRFDPQLLPPLAAEALQGFFPEAPSSGTLLAEPGVTAEFVVEQQLDLAADGEWLDQLAKDIAATAEGEAPLRFRLNPETLGTLKVEVSQGQAGASVRLTTDTEAARAIIADAQPRLVAEAKTQGLRIAETHVDLGTGSQSNAGDPRRQQDAEKPAVIRTAGGEPAQPQQTERGPTRGSDRYA